MKSYPKEILDLGKTIFNYLYIQDPIEKADAIIGFGHFDLKIPRRCAELYLNGYASKIIFTGGVGAGSADFKEPEAIEFLNLLKKEFPEIPEKDIITESNSTNTGENLQFTNEVLEKLNPIFTFTYGIRKVLKVSNAYRQRRAYLTCKKIYPHIEFINTPAKTNFETEAEMYQVKGQDLLRHLSGEIERMLVYPAKGFIVADNIPENIIQAHIHLQAYAKKYN